MMQINGTEKIKNAVAVMSNTDTCKDSDGTNYMSNGRGSRVSQFSYLEAMKSYCRESKSLSGELTQYQYIWVLPLRSLNVRVRCLFYHSLQQEPGRWK